MVVLTFVGNTDNLTFKEIIEIKRLPYLNSINRSEISVKIAEIRSFWK